MIDAALFEKLFVVFPDSFSIKKTYEEVRTISTPWGLETENTGETKEETLAECILYTAQAILVKYGEERAIDYIKDFGKKRVQESETKAFLR